MPGDSQAVVTQDQQRQTLHRLRKRVRCCDTKRVGAERRSGKRRRATLFFRLGLVMAKLLMILEAAAIYLSAKNVALQVSELTD